MTFAPGGEPPPELRLDLEEALELLEALEEARLALMTRDHLVEALQVFAQIQRISHTLGFDEPEGGNDAN